MNPRTAILLLVLALAAQASAQDVLISEFMARNRNLPDEDGQPSDWIELFNPGTEIASMSGWSLTDDPANLTKWTFPAVSIGPHEFLLVWASGKNRRSPGLPLHTSFSLSAEGDYLALVRPDGESVVTEFAPVYPRQVVGLSYGFSMIEFEVLTNWPVHQPPTPRTGNGNVEASPRIVLTELMYHPTVPPGSAYAEEAFEFIELKNAGLNTIDLFSCRLIEGDVRRPSLSFTFTNSVFLAAGERILLVANREAFVARYTNDLVVVGEFLGSLPNSGGQFMFLGRYGEAAFNFQYEDSWHRLTDGRGFSLVPVNENSSPVGYGQPGVWRPSSGFGGSPGQAEPPQNLAPPILVNEVLSRPELPFEDAIELYNPTDAEVDISGWWLTDESSTPEKFQIPEGTFIPAHGFLAMDEHSFNRSAEFGNWGFSFKEEGEGVYLFSADANGNLTGYMHGFKFDAAETNVTFGRHVTSTGEEQFVAQRAMTFLAPNVGPKVGPIVITEIHYQPVAFIPGYDPGLLEYIELRNVTDDAVPLYDTASPINSWKLRDAVGFTFPAGAVIPPGGIALVVPFSPTNLARVQIFQAAHDPPPGTLIWGPWSGGLKNSGESIELVRAEQFASNSVGSILVDKVVYSSSPPWPAGANGTGASLQRIDALAYGNDPANWRAALKSPGQANAPLPGSPPTAVLELRDIIVPEGSDLSFRVSATGPEPIHFQWLLNGLVVTGAVDATLDLPGVSPDWNGRYSCWAFNPYGVARTASALLTVIPTSGANQPSLSITSPPASFVIVTTNRLTLAGTASDDLGLARVVIQRSGGSDAPVSGATAWSVGVTGLDASWSRMTELVPGSNTFQVVAVDLSGNLSVPSSITAYWGGSPLWLGTNGEGSVTGPTNGQLLIFGESYTLSASPAPGHVFTHWTENFFGRTVSTQPTLSFVASSNVALVANFMPDPFPGLQGTYAGLFYQPDEPAHDSAGEFTFTVGRRGGYTGWVRHQGKRYSWHGQFDLSLSSRREFMRHDTNVLSMTLQLAGDSDGVTGSVSNGVFVSELSGIRIHFSRKNPATHLAGRYSLSFQDAGPAGASASHHDGRLLVRSSGQAGLRIKLPDGARVVRITPVIGEGWLPFFEPLYRQRGSIFGWLTLDNLANDTFMGSVHWTRPNSGSPPGSVPATQLEAHAVRTAPTAVTAPRP